MSYNVHFASDCSDNRLSFKYLRFLNKFLSIKKLNLILLVNIGDNMTEQVMLDLINRINQMKDNAVLEETISSEEEEVFLGMVEKTEGVTGKEEKYLDGMKVNLALIRPDRRIQVFTRKEPESLKEPKGNKLPGHRASWLEEIPSVGPYR